MEQRFSDILVALQWEFQTELQNVLQRLETLLPCAGCMTAETVNRATRAHYRLLIILQKLQGTGAEQTSHAECRSFAILGCKSRNDFHAITFRNAVLL